MNCARQLTHTPPLLPQLACAVPATQVPTFMPIGMLQQPPLHAVLASHAVLQVLVTALHAWPAGQSIAELQPQVTMLLSTTQAPPFMLPTQVVQTAAVAH